VENQSNSQITRLQEQLELFKSAERKQITFTNKTINSNFNEQSLDLINDLNELISDQKAISGNLYNKSYDSNYLLSKKNIAKIFKIFNDVDSRVQQIFDFQKIRNEVSSIKNFPSYILNLNIFKNFQSCQILIHEKGNSTFDSYHCNRFDEKKLSNGAIKTFNHLFNLVKKSKSKYFNQSQILEKDLEILGTFLARELELKSYNIIIILSRNDFLPADKDEQIYFTELTALLEPIFTTLLNIEKVSLKYNSIKDILDCIPWPICLKDRSEHIIFYNKSFNLQKVSDNSNFNHQPNYYPLINSFKLFFYPHKQEQLVTDIFHFQRISLLGELLNTLQHELSNPLFGLKLTSDLLATETSDPENQELINDISTNSLRCQTIIKNFSNLYESNDSLTEVDLEKVIGEVFTLTKSETKQIPKVIEFDKSHSSYTLLSNSTWINQILFNLLVNAAQAIKTTGDDLNQSKISIFVTKLVNDDIIINITDTGPGIGSEKSEEIFVPFFTTKEKGTGLGLAICRNLIDKLNGSLTFTSNQAGRGTTFKLVFPNLTYEKNITD
jgi:two-component system NtrC family sensor kinase